MQKWKNMEVGKLYRPTMWMSPKGPDICLLIRIIAHEFQDDGSQIVALEFLRNEKTYLVSFASNSDPSLQFIEAKWTKQQVYS